MLLAVTYALLAGILVSLSRQLNGRLSLSSSALKASFWNHIVGFAALTALGLVIGGLIPDTLAEIPLPAFLGGPLGVVFVASGSWLIARIGAVNTAMLVIGGQMVSGVLLDLARGAGADLPLNALGVALILAGTALTGRRRPASS